MKSDVYLIPDTAPGVATIRLDRPKVNALNAKMADEIAGICEQLRHDDSIRAVVIWGGPRVFAAGADIAEFPSLDPASAQAFSQRFNQVMLEVERLGQITISAINGYCLGGGLELALSTDFRMAAADAALGVPEIQLGLIPGAGGTQRLSRLAGVTMAKEMVYTGVHIDAETALANRIVSSVHEPESLYDDAVAKAAQYAKGPAALRMAKTAILDGLHLPLDEAVEVESQQWYEVFGTEDCRIGVKSFLESGPGKADFSGR